MFNCWEVIAWTEIVRGQKDLCIEVFSSTWFDKINNIYWWPKSKEVRMEWNGMEWNGMEWNGMGIFIF